jgi:alpha-tubulin suppressor-like RCC1 family protein
MQVITDTGTDNLSMKSQAESWTDLVSVSSHAYGIIGLKNDGTVVATEDESPSKWYAGAAEISDWTDIQQITCGTYITVGLKSDGTVVATKYTGDIKYNKGQSNASNWTDIVSIAAGSTHTVGLKSDMERSLRVG